MRGDKMLEIEKNKLDLDVSYILKEVRKQGVTDNDIREWWNLPDEQHKEIMEEDDDACRSAINQLIDSGISRDEAILKLKKGYPIFGEYMPGIMHDDKDDILPYELKIRVNNFFNSVEKLTGYKEDIEKASSMNSFIRSLVKKDLI
jgi:hypothetical protein